MSMMRALPILLLLAGCNKLLGIPGGGNITGDGGDGDGPPPGVNCESTPNTCALFAVDREVSQSPFPITLEGTFGNVVMVEFPGGIMVNANMVGSHRAVVPVPDGAVAGDLKVMTAGVTVGNVRFRGTTFPVGAAHFQLDYHQTSGARQGLQLPTPRAFATAHAIKRFLYVFGGDEVGNAKSAVDVAPINGDGTLGKFGIGASQLTEVRRRHVSVVVGNFVYVIGGQGVDMATGLASIERAVIADDGSLGNFQVVAGNALTTARVSATAQIIGDVLYVIGGAGGGGAALDSVEAARIRPDGTLEPFAVVGTLAAARATHTSAVVGGSLYVIAGVPQLGGPALSTIERAAIEPDGTISAFGIVPGVQLAEARSAHSSAVLGNKILVMGGTNDGNAVSSAESLMLDMMGNITTATTTHQLSKGRAGAASVIVDTDLHLIGGIDFTVPTTPVFLRNSDHASINVGGGLDAPIAASFATPGRTTYSMPVIGNFLYAVGGVGPGGAFPDSIERAVITADGIGTFAIASGSIVGQPTVAHSFVVTGSFAYTLGGTSAVQTIVNVQEASVSATGDISTFSDSGASGALTNAREFSTAVMVGGTVYVFGGRANGSGLSSVEQSTIQVDGGLGGFGGAVSLSAPRRGHCTAVIRDKVYMVGGGIGASDTTVGSIDICPIQANGMIGNNCSSVGTALVTPRKEHTCAVIGNFFYVMGGQGIATALTSIERSQILPDGNLMGFSIVGATLGTARANARTLVLGNRLFVLGGDDGSFIFNNAEQMTLR